MQTRDRIRIDVVTHTNITPVSGMLEGIHAYMLRDQRWRLRRLSMDRPDLTDLLTDGTSAGVLGILTSLDHVHAAAELAKPVVRLESGGHGRADLISVLPDDRRVGQLAGEHLCGLGFRRLAFLGLDAPWSLDRGAGFAEVVSARGLGPPETHLLPPMPESPEPWVDEPACPAATRAWLETLEPPLAVFAACDIFGQYVVEAALAMGLDVPDQLAVLGVDNDIVNCDNAAVPLSSIDKDYRRIGFEAAAMLDRLLAGEPVPHPPVLIEPKAVVTRQSTQTLGFDDSVLRKAVGLIRERATEGIDIDDVLDVVAVSRSTLHRRFVDALGHGPGEEIRRVRLERGRRLLLETSLPVVEVSVACGFNSVAHFTRAFKASFGLAPRQYARQSR